MGIHLKPFFRFTGHSICHLLPGLGAHRIAAGLICTSTRISSTRIPASDGHTDSTGPHTLHPPIESVQNDIYTGFILLTPSQPLPTHLVCRGNTRADFANVRLSRGTKTTNPEQTMPARTSQLTCVWNQGTNTFFFTQI